MFEILGVRRIYGINEPHATCIHLYSPKTSLTQLPASSRLFHLWHFSKSHLTSLIICGKCSNLDIFLTLFSTKPSKISLSIFYNVYYRTFLFFVLFLLIYVSPCTFLCFVEEDLTL